MSKREFEKVVYNGEEYAVVPICPMTGYPKRYVEGKTPEEVEEFFEFIRDFLARGLYDRMERYGALKRTDTVSISGVTTIECEALVLVKCQENHGEDQEPCQDHVEPRS